MVSLTEVMSKELQSLKAGGPSISERKQLVRIGVGELEATRHYGEQRKPAATSNSGSFNMLVSASEREFLGRLAKAIEDNASRSLFLVVQPLEEALAEKVEA